LLQRLVLGIFARFLRNRFHVRGACEPSLVSKCKRWRELAARLGLGELPANSGGFLELWQKWLICIRGAGGSCQETAGRECDRR
jgi:hypothetical protein